MPMRAFRDLSIRWKLTLIIMLTSTAALLLVAVFFIVSDVMTVRRTKAEDLLGLAQVIGTNCTAALLFDDRKSAEETLSAVRARPSIVFACIYDKTGKVFAQYTRPDKKGLVPPPTPGADGYRFAEGTLQLFRPILDENGRIGTIYIQTDMDEIVARLRRDVEIILLTMLAASIAAWLLSARLQRVISRPISELAQTAKIVSDEQNYAIRATKQSQDEIGFLI